MSGTAPQPSQPEIDWINLAAGSVPTMDAALNADALKRKMLDDARKKIDSQVGEIHVGEDFKVETLSGFLKRKITMASIGENPNEEFDSEHDGGKATGMDGKSFALLMNAQSLIVGEVETLRTAKNPQTKKPLFSDKEISAAIWAPLMRRKLIPENAIPARYSEVATTFSGASAAYETRLAAYTDGLSKFDKAIQALGVTKDVIDGVAALATGVTADLGALGVTMDPYEVATIIKGVQLTLDSGATVTTAVLKENGEFNWTCMEAVCKDLQKTVPALINASQAAKSWDDVNFGKMIAYAVGGAFSAPLIIKKIKDGKYAEILDDLGDMTLAACNAYTYEVKSTGGTDKGPGGTGTLQTNEFGAVLSGIIKTGSASLVELLKDEKPDTAAMMRILQTAAKATIDATSLIEFDHAKSALEAEAADNDGTTKSTDNATVQPDSPDLALAYGVIEPEWQAMRDAAAGSTGFATPEKIMKEVQAHGSAALKKLHKDDPLIKTMAKFADLVDKQQKAIVDAGLATFDDEMAADDKKFRDLLARSESGDEEKEVEQIEQLVMELKKDQLITDLAFQLASLPAQAVAAFLPQANIAVASIALIKNIYKAIEHFKAYFEWQENVRDAHSAMSIQVEAMANRMNISGGKGRDEILSGLENAAKIVAGAVGCAGPFAPAGHVISATVAAVSTIRQLITKYATEAELKKAWKLYQAALDNPDDRKTIRAAIRKNPTLSKYVIAWGAEVEGNSVAKAAMQKCGLTADVLSNPSSNVSKVVTYLEALYPEDPVLLHAVDRPEDWYPGPVEFSAASLAAFVGAARTATKPPLAGGTCDALIAAFSRMERAGAAIKTATKTWQDESATLVNIPATDSKHAKAVVDEHRALLALSGAADEALQSSQAVLGALKTFKPVDQTRQPHKSFAVYTGMLVPTARQFVEKYKREAEAWAAQVSEDEA
jgi:hypothetical protein